MPVAQAGPRIPTFICAVTTCPGPDVFLETYKAPHEVATGEPAALLRLQPGPYVRGQELSGKMNMGREEAGGS